MTISSSPLRALRTRLAQLLPSGGAPGAASDGAPGALGMTSGGTPAPIGAHGAADEDAAILRDTRLRLMAVSGLVTLAILVLLGFAVYEIVSTAIDVGARNQLERVAEGNSDANQDPGIVVEGDSAGIIRIVIDPSGTVHVPVGVTGIPAGLPNPQSLAAVHQRGDIDIRNVTTADGTPYRVISGFAERPIGWRLQFAQSRAGETALLNTLRLVLLGGGLVALLAALVAGYFYAGRALVPIRASLSRQRDALKRQRDFTANASHELRTPLTIIRASVEDLRRNRRSRVEEVGEALGDIDAEVSHLTALVEDLLLLARTDSGVVQMERLPLDLADVAADAASSLAPLGEERGVRIVLDPLPAPIVGDPLRLRQLVTILVDNAIRHGGRGSDVIVHVKEDSAGAGALLGVEDQGPGIKPEDLPRVFERFWRGDSAPAGGTGLGLAIAKWIVEQHGGTIVASNRPEGGARFLVRLPAGALPDGLENAEADMLEEPELLPTAAGVHSASRLEERVVDPADPAEAPVWAPPTATGDDEADVRVSADRG